jgi:hypothetical protein
MKREYHTKFNKVSSLDFEPLTDFYIQRIVLHIINCEFSLITYKKEKVIIDHFPLHEFGKKNLIIDYWNM